MSSRLEDCSKVNQQGSKMARVSGRNAGGARVTILDAAEELFAQSGFDGVPVREVAKKAGVALSLVTYHFPSKTELLKILWDNDESYYRYIFQLPNDFTPQFEPPKEVEKVSWNGTKYMDVEEEE